MRNIVIGLIIGVVLTAGVSYGYRIPKPQRITAFDHNGLVIINEALEQLWDITNGRYNMPFTTSNPDGTVKGTAGDFILYNASGTYYLEVCAGGTIWRGEALSDTP